MKELTRQEYNDFCKQASLSAKPYTFPDLSLLEMINKSPNRYVGWALWLYVNLPSPRNQKEETSMDMLSDFLAKNLVIIN